jgi:hypothetical protein
MGGLGYRYSLSVNILTHRNERYGMYVVGGRLQSIRKGLYFGTGEKLAKDCGNSVSCKRNACTRWGIIIISPSNQSQVLFPDGASALLQRLYDEDEADKHLFLFHRQSSGKNNA